MITPSAERYSSRFLGLVAGAVTMSCSRPYDIERLAGLFGHSSMWTMFEQTANWQLLNSTGDHNCFRVSDGRIVPLPFGNRNAVMFHDVADIRNIPASVSAYALPNNCNFPILDAILPPCYRLKMTIAKTLEVSTSDLANIVSGMELASNTELHIAFVVPDILDFTPPVNLPGIQLYVTTPDCTTEVVMKKCLSKKRERQDCDCEEDETSAKK